MKYKIYYTRSAIFTNSTLQLPSSCPIADSFSN